MKKLLFIVFILCVFLFAEKSLASWHAGNRRSLAYGVKTNIFTPYTPPYMYPYIGISQSNWVSTPGSYWLQIGWIYYYGWDQPLAYYEYCVYPCLSDDDYEQEWFEFMDWNTYTSFRVQNIPSINKTYGTWCAYKNDIAIICSPNLVNPPVEVQVMSESHHPWNDINTYYTSVSYLDSSRVWHPFDLSL
jgi:hypothetical protein